MSTYQTLDNGDFILVGATYHRVPNEPRNSDYIKMQKEVSGRTSVILPYVEPPEPDATSCTKLKMLEELASLGREQDLYNALGQSETMMRRWVVSGNLEIDHPMVAGMSQILGYSAEEMQVLFNNASKRTY